MKVYCYISKNVDDRKIEVIMFIIRFFVRLSLMSFSGKISKYETDDSDSVVFSISNSLGYIELTYEWK